VTFVAKQYGVSVIPEPDYLAQDNISPANLLTYAIGAATGSFENEQIVVDIRATNPLKLVNDIDGMIVQLANSPHADMICGVARVFDHHPSRMKMITGSYLTNFLPETSDQRQNLEPLAYIRNGSVYAIWRSKLEAGIFQRNSQKILPWIMPPERSVNIDELPDLLVAEWYLRRRENAN
jgi:CMP-N-acetylneuraminic acid synthetase